MQIGLFDKRGVGISGGGSPLVMIMMMIISMINMMKVMMIVL